MASKRNPLRDPTPTESDLDTNNTSSSSSTQGKGEKLREKASKSLHGPDEAGSQSSSAPPSRSGSSGQPGHEKLREKVAKKLHGPGANPSQLGDPISPKAEQSDNVPTPGEEGAHPGGREQQKGVQGRPSKL